MTLERVKVNLAKAFEPSQVYLRVRIPIIMLTLADPYCSEQGTIFGGIGGHSSTQKRPVRRERTSKEVL